MSSFFSTSTLLAVASFVPLFFIFWTLSSTSSSPFTGSLPTLRNKRICLLIAHPDDEAMFFSPTLLALTKPELGNHVKILCLSSGDADGLGHVRTKELSASATILGLRNGTDVFVVNDPSRFPDGMQNEWPAASISSLLASAFAPELGAPQSAKSTADRPPAATIDILLTFDQGGVSGHINHRSLYHGAVAFLRTLMKGKAGHACPVTLYTLTSTNIVRKYAGVLDAPLSLILGTLGNLFDGKANTAVAAPSTSTTHESSALRAAPKDQLAKRLLFVADVFQWSKAREAMTQGHKSQMVWFRWGWITIGRYMVVNDLQRVAV